MKGTNAPRVHSKEYLFSNLENVTMFNADGNRAEFKNELHLLRVGVI
jgi:hypothetical protein